jgi:ribonuclease HI
MQDDPATSRGQFIVYSDASIKGDWIRRFSSSGKRAPQRKREGPAMGAWIGWCDCEPSARPTVAGQAYLGVQGTQRAEYLAAIHALGAVLTHVRLNRLQPLELVLCVDNVTVVKTLLTEWATSALRPHWELADRIGRELAAEGISVFINEVSEKHAQHKAAHRMSRSAWDQLFFREEWRPATHPPAEWSQTTPSSTTSTM